jgi:hypothetical protein
MWYLHNSYNVWHYFFLKNCYMDSRLAIVFFGFGEGEMGGRNFLFQ